jgi:DNA-binding transcriptional ArsR family regulator
VKQSPLISLASMPTKSNEATAELATALRALGHPVRIRLLREAEEGVKLSASKAQEWVPDVSLGTLAYHVRCLADAGLLRKAGLVPRRGAVEHLYLLTPLGVRLAGVVEQLGDLPRASRK